MYLGPTDPESTSYDPAVARQSAIPFSTNVRDMNPMRPVLLGKLCPISNGLFQPAIIFIFFAKSTVYLHRDCAKIIIDKDKLFVAGPRPGS